MTEVCFACQGCGSALKIDESFERNRDKLITSYKTSPRDMIGHQKNSVSTLNEEELEIKLGLLKFDYSNLPTNEEDEVSLSDSDKALGELFNQLTTELGIDHPICQSCADKVIRHFDKVTEKIEKEYEEFYKLNQFLHQKFDCKENQSQIFDDEEEQLSKLLEEESRLEEELNRVEEERCRVLAEIESYSREIDASEKEINKYQKRTIDIQEELHSLEIESQDLDYGIHYCKNEIKYLSSTNPLDLAFSISFDGHCGTVNGFRLGFIPSSQILTSELNAALGQTAFIIKVLFRLQSLDHPHYEILPLGSSSSIKYKGTKSRVYPLYLTEVKKLSDSSPFNEGLVGLLRCLEVLVSHITLSDSSYEFPCTIVNDHILVAGFKYPICFKGTDDVMWTTSMKYFLSFLKLAMVWSSRNI